MSIHFALWAPECQCTTMCQEQLYRCKIEVNKLCLFLLDILIFQSSGECISPTGHRVALEAHIQLTVSDPYILLSDCVPEGSPLSYKHDWDSFFNIELDILKHILFAHTQYTIWSRSLCTSGLLSGSFTVPLISPGKFSQKFYVFSCYYRTLTELTFSHLRMSQFSFCL